MNKSEVPTKIVVGKGNAKKKSYTIEDTYALTKERIAQKNISEECRVLAELCSISYTLTYAKPGGNQVKQSGAALNLFTANTKYECKIANEYIGIKYAVFARPSSKGIKNVVVFSGDNLQGVKVEEWHTALNDSVRRANEDFVGQLLLEITRLLREDLSGLERILVTGHGIGGSYAEIVSYVLNMSGIAFCTLGLGKNSCGRYVNQVNKINKEYEGNRRFLCLLSTDDSAKASNSKHVIQKIFKVTLFDNPDNRNYAELHSIKSFVRYFNRTPFNQMTNFDLKKDLIDTSIGSDLKGVNVVYDAGANVIMPSPNTSEPWGPENTYTLTMYVMDLTLKSIPLVDSIGLECAIAAINKQIREHVSGVWHAHGELVELDFAYEDLQKEKIMETKPRDVAVVYNDWFVKNIERKNVDPDWLHTGLIYLIDPDLVTSLRTAGAHGCTSTLGYQIPYAFVNVSDMNWTHTLSHEALEMLINPRLGRFMNRRTLLEFVDTKTFNRQSWKEQNWDIEISDACQHVGYQIELSSQDFVKYTQIYDPKKSKVELVSKEITEVDVDPVKKNVDKSINEITDIKVPVKKTEDNTITDVVNVEVPVKKTEEKAVNKVNDDDEAEEESKSGLEVTNVKSKSILVSDFVLPEYFNVTKIDTPLNYIGLDAQIYPEKYVDQDIKKLTLSRSKVSPMPFPLLPGGYTPILNPNTNQEVNVNLSTDGKVFYDYLDVSIRFSTADHVGK